MSNFILKLTEEKNTLLTVTALIVLLASGATVIFWPFGCDAQAWRTTAAIQCWGGGTIVSALTLLSVRILGKPLWSKHLCFTLGAAMLLMLLGAMWNLEAYCTLSQSWEHPELSMWSDSWREYTQSLLALQGRYDEMLGNSGYAILLSLLMRLFGTTSLLPALLLNIIFTSGAAALCGAVCVRLMPRRNARKVMWGGTLLFLLIPCTIYYGTVVMKESSVCFAVTMMSVMLADGYMNRLRPAGVVAGVVGAALLMLVKSPMGWMLAVGCVIAVIRVWFKYHKSVPRVPRGAQTLLALLLLCVAVVRGGAPLRQVNDMELISAENADHMSYDMIRTAAVGKYHDVIDGYYDGTVIEKIAWLPVGCVTQYLPPFPWNFTRDTYLARTVVWAHLSLLWYIIGGLAIGWTILCSFRKSGAGLLGWGLWWWLCYAGIAYFSGGTVPRYYLPLLAGCIPLSLQMLLAVRDGVVSRTVFTRFSVIYGVVLLGCLTVSYVYLMR